MSAEDMVERRTGVLGGVTGEADAGTEASSSIKAGVVETVLEDGLSSAG
jgi:hypothetical protein